MTDGEDSKLIEDPFAVVEQLEHCAAEIYRCLADQFHQSHEKVAQLFEQLALEEEQHAHRVSMLRRELLRAPERVGELTVDLGQLRALEVESEALLQLVRQGPAMRLDEAKQIAVSLEERFADVHAHAMTRAADPELREMFAALAAGDRAHRALLRRMTG